MKYCFILLLSVCLLGCQKKDTAYYWQHPKEIKAALTSCAKKGSGGLGCETLQEIATKFRFLGAELKQNPQLFGLRIIALQQQISKQNHLVQSEKNPALAKSLSDNQQRLSQYLAVVGYYESPLGAPHESIGQ